MIKLGKYIFDNAEINEHTLKDNKFLKLFHKRLGFVFQNSDAQLFCATVFEELAFGLLQMELPEEEVNKSGKTIICAAHDFEYIEGVFDRTIVFSEDHKIIRDDKYENIINDKDFLR